MDPILFYGPRRPYYEFSNWYMGTSFQLDGETWATSEHYYMAQKTTNEMLKERIRKARTPREAKRLAGPRGIITLRPGWDEMR